MIHYSLRCSQGHEFDAWFRDASSFDEQVACGEVECPYCGDPVVTRAPMAPNINRGVASTGPAPAEHPPVTAADIEMITEGAQAVMVPPETPQGQKLQEMIAAVRQHIQENCDYVGDRFVDEARQIHYGEAEERGIYGDASIDDAQSLRDEGIDVTPLPFRIRTDS